MCRVKCEYEHINGFVRVPNDDVRCTCTAVSQPLMRFFATTKSLSVMLTVT